MEDFSQERHWQHRKRTLEPENVNRKWLHLLSHTPSMYSAIYHISCLQPILGQKLYVHHRPFMGKTGVTGKRTVCTLQHHISGATGTCSVWVPCDLNCSLAVLRASFEYTSSERETLPTGTWQCRSNTETVRGSSRTHPRHWQRSAFT